MALLEELKSSEIYNLKKKYFEQAQEVIFRNINVKVCPMPSDIPMLEKHYYDQHSDILSIIFKNSGKINQKQVDDTMIFLTDTETGYFAGIKIIGMKAQNIQTISLTIEKELSDYINEMRRRLSSFKNEDLFKALANFDMNDRRTGFIKELVEKELSGRPAQS